MGDHRASWAGLMLACIVLAGCTDSGHGAHARDATGSPSRGTSPAGAFPPPSDGAPSAALVAAWQQQLDQLVALSKAAGPGSASYVASGVAMAVVSDRMSWSGAAGVDGCGRAMQARGMFNIASVTKTFVAAEVVHLAARGQVDLDAPMSRYVPGALASRAGTVRQALSMRNGIRDQEPYRAADVARLRDATKHWSPQEALRLNAGRPVAPSSTPFYANTNYILLGMLIAHVTGAEPAKALRADLITPAGLDRVAVQDAEKPSAPITAPDQEPVSQRGDAPAGLPCGGPTGGYVPTRAVVTSSDLSGDIAADVPSVARWGYELYGGRVLPPASVAQMTNAGPETLKNIIAFRYGLGTLVWRTAGGYDAVGHSGGDDGSSTFLVVVPSHHIAIAVMFPRSAGSGELPSLVDNLLEAAFQIH